MVSRAVCGPTVQHAGHRPRGSEVVPPAATRAEPGRQWGVTRAGCGPIVQHAGHGNGNTSRHARNFGMALPPAKGSPLSRETRLCPDHGITTSRYPTWTRESAHCPDPRNQTRFLAHLRDGVVLRKGQHLNQIPPRCAHAAVAVDGHPQRQRRLQRSVHSAAW